MADTQPMQAPRRSEPLKAEGVSADVGIGTSSMIGADTWLAGLFSEVRRGRS